MSNSIKSIFWIGLLFIVFLGVRFVFLQTHFHFLYDQALFSLKALELWQNKEPALIGPPTPFVVANRYIFQGSLIYYIFLALLLPSKFDPLIAAQTYTVLAGIMIIPLFYGAKWLINQSSALLLVVIYVLGESFLLPTTQLWNPNFQIVLLPGLIFLMGLFKRNNYKLWILLVMSIYLGAMTQLHYQMVVVDIGLFIYYFAFLKLKKISAVIFAIGILMGMANLVIFELRNDFYNLRTIMLYANNWDQLWGERQGAMPAYYFTTILSMTGLALVAILKRYINNLMIVAVTILLTIRLISTLSTPITDITKDWAYEDEIKTNQIIKDQGLANFNIAMFYEANATPQKYFFKRDFPMINLSDYYSNQWLFVVYEDEEWRNNGAYEMSSFGKGEITKSWRINERYTLFLVKK